MIENRRTVAIIAHPDAGKTTLTEKLLLHSGAIHRAGSIRARKADRHALSDWMDMEQERGISITSSVLQFEQDDIHVNLLDTPGHADFSADTYRTMLAADSAILVLDGTRGVERQTPKLFRFARRHGIPMFLFINKYDRYGREPLELLDQVAEQLDVDLYPVTWPIGRGKRFRGVVDRSTGRIQLHELQGQHGQEAARREEYSLDELGDLDVLDGSRLEELGEELELLEIAGDSFDRERFLEGRQAPVFFGSAQTNVGVPEFLDHLVRLAPEPQPKGPVDPRDPDFSGYIFKIQANMDPNHRDRMAFMRICSGTFRKDMETTIQRTGETVKLAQPRQFMGQDRDSVEEAYPGDVVGLFDPGQFHIGDSLSNGRSVEFNQVPRFSPEHFARLKVKEAFKRKHLEKGLAELAEEGAVQVFEPWDETGGDPIIGVVGELQFDVLKYRLEEEYGVEVRFDRLPYKFARWVGDLEAAEQLKRGTYRTVLRDQYDEPLVLFKTKHTLRRAEQDNPEVEFHETAPLFK